MKKVVSVVLVCAFLVGLLSACNSGSGSTKVSGQLIRGSTTTANAAFNASYINNATSMYVEQLFSGYGTVAWTKEGVYAYDEKITVKSHDAVVNADGTKTYTIEIKNNLKWNDDTKITAKDYVFNLLHSQSPELSALGFTTGDLDDYVGFESFYYGYRADEDGNYIDESGNVILSYDEVDHDDFSNVERWRKFEGVRLLGDYKFSVTVKATSLPYYYDITFAAVTPYPMHVIAPGCDVVDNGDGAELTGPYSVDLLTETIMDADNGYLYKPTVTCGPYNFVSFNPEDNMIIMEANEKYLGAYDGAKAKIQTLIFKNVAQATMFDELEAGEVDLLDRVGGGEMIERGLSVVDANPDEFTNISYSRNGYGKIAFRCDFSPTQFAEVRQAIAYCLDRDEFARVFTGGYGIVVHGYYGQAMREYKDNIDTLNTRLNQYTYNIDKAKEVLREGGWVLNKDGGAYDENSTDVRYKKLDDGTLMPLIIEWNSSEGNAVSTLILSMLPAEAEKAGIQINQNVTTFDTLLENLYEVDNPQFSMYNMATDFAKVQGVWYYYSDNPDYFGTYNSNFILDTQLSDLAKDMKATESGDFKAWSEKWVEFQVRFNELMPDIPLYSNVYFDFFNSKLENYETDPAWTFEYAILRANVK